MFALRYRGALLVALMGLPGLVISAPACVVPAEKNIVVARSPSNLADGHSAQWRLERIDGGGHVLLKPCSGRTDNTCYFATDVAPGRYFFREVVPGAKNRMEYPVSAPDDWFEIGGKQVDYIGDWIIERKDRRTSVSVQLRYDLESLDAIIERCGLDGRRIFIGRIRVPSMELVDSGKGR